MVTILGFDCIMVKDFLPLIASLFSYKQHPYWIKKNVQLTLSLSLMVPLA
jgi:hypothetical protein